MQQIISRIVFALSLVVFVSRPSFGLHFDKLPSDPSSIEDCAYWMGQALGLSSSSTNSKPVFQHPLSQISEASDDELIEFVEHLIASSQSAEAKNIWILAIALEVFEREDADLSRALLKQILEFENFDPDIAFFVAELLLGHELFAAGDLEQSLDRPTHETSLLYAWREATRKRAEAFKSWLGGALFASSFFGGVVQIDPGLILLYMLLQNRIPVPDFSTNESRALDEITPSSRLSSSIREKLKKVALHHPARFIRKRAVRKLIQLDAQDELSEILASLSENQSAAGSALDRARQPLNDLLMTPLRRSAKILLVINAIQVDGLLFAALPATNYIRIPAPEMAEDLILNAMNGATGRLDVQLENLLYTSEHHPSPRIRERAAKVFDQLVEQENQRAEFLEAVTADWNAYQTKTNELIGKLESLQQEGAPISEQTRDEMNDKVVEILEILDRLTERLEDWDENAQRPALPFTESELPELSSRAQELAWEVTSEDPR